jgi:serine/threonine-protein kinase
VPVPRDGKAFGVGSASVPDQGADSSPAAGHSAAPPSGAAGAAVAGTSRGADRAARRTRLLGVTGAVLLLGVAGLLWWWIGAGDGARTGPAIVAPGLSGAPGSVAPAPGRSAAGDERSVPTRAQPPGGTATGIPDDGGIPLPLDPPPAAGAPVTTTAGPVKEQPPVPTTTLPRTTEPTAGPTAEVRSFSSNAGSVRATCSSPSTPDLLSWSATKPYKVNDVDEGAAAVVFKHGNRLVRMSVTCSGGVPSGSTGEG